MHCPEPQGEKGIEWMPAALKKQEERTEANGSPTSTWAIASGGPLRGSRDSGNTLGRGLTLIHPEPLFSVSMKE